MRARVCAYALVFMEREGGIVNSYKYLGYILTTKFSSNSACEEYDSKA